MLRCMSLLVWTSNKLSTIKCPKSATRDRVCLGCCIDMFLRVNNIKDRKVLYLLEYIAYDLDLLHKSKSLRRCLENQFPNILTYTQVQNKASRFPGGSAPPETGISRPGGLHTD